MGLEEEGDAYEGMEADLRTAEAALGISITTSPCGVGEEDEDEQELLAAMLAAGGFGSPKPSAQRQSILGSATAAAAASMVMQAAATGRRESVSANRRQEIMGQERIVGADGVEYSCFNLKVVFQPYR